MKRKVAFFLGASIAIFCIALPAGHLAAEEGARAGDAIVSCTAWMNCDEDSPNYTGFCCRCCTHRSGQRNWECRETLAKAERRDVLIAEHAPAGEATLSGIVTRQGLLEADDGRAYAVAGDKAEELAGKMGRKIEVKGTVQEVQGRVAIDVQAYELVWPETPAPGDPFGSCTEWMNCDSRPPTFTGTCCRQCEDKQRTTLWDCKVFSSGEYFNLAEWLD